MPRINENAHYYKISCAKLFSLDYLVPHLILKINRIESKIVKSVIFKYTKLNQISRVISKITSQVEENYIY